MSLEPIPDYGDLITTADFEESVRGDSFIDYDGHGYYSDGKQMSREKVVKPSTFLKDDERGKWTHVVWFNR